MKQWKSLVALHSSAPSCFPQQPSTPSPCPSPPREAEEKHHHRQAVRLVGCDGRVRTYRRAVTARELMQQHPRHLVCRSDALLIGEKIPAVAPAEELQPGQAYFLLPAHLFHSVLSFVSLASSLLLLLSTSPASSAGGKKQHRPFELLRTDSGTLQIKFSDDFLVDDNDAKNPSAAADAPRLPRHHRCCAGTRGWRRSTRSLSGTARPGGGRPSWRPSKKWLPPPPPPPPAAERGKRGGSSPSSGGSGAGGGRRRRRPPRSCAAMSAPWRAPAST